MGKSIKGAAKCVPFAIRMRLFWQPRNVSGVGGRTRRSLRLGTVFVLLSVLSACGTMSSTPPVTVAKNHAFALLAFENLSVTPQAEERLRSLLETRLRRNGVSEVYVYSSSKPSTLRALLNAETRRDDATRWAVQRGARYGLSGTVHEWQYLSGADSEPTVGITLTLIDLTTDKVLWQGNAARSGFGYANLSAIADKTLSELLSKVTFSQSIAGIEQRRSK